MSDAKRSSPSALPLFKSAEGEARFMEAYDAVLRGWPVSYQELDVPTRLGMTHLIASGAAGAPALMLVPSMAGTATLWRPNVAALSEHYRTYAVDVIGQVGKSVASRRIRSRQEFADWFVDILDDLGIDRAAIVGSSYGGFLAMNQAALTPDRVDRIVLISPAGTFVGGLAWVFLRSMLKRLVLRKRPREITDLLGPDARLGPDERYRVGCVHVGGVVRVGAAKSGGSDRLQQRRPRGDPPTGPPASWRKGGALRPAPDADAGAGPDAEPVGQHRAERTSPRSDGVSRRCQRENPNVVAAASE